MMSFSSRIMNLEINDDETMSRNRSEYVNQLLERNRQVIPITTINNI